MISSYLGKNKTLYIFSFQPYSEHIEEAKTGVCCGCTTMVIATVVSQTPQITSTTLHYVTKQEALIQNTRKHTYSSLLDSPKANSCNFPEQTSHAKAYWNKLNNASSILGDHQYELYIAKQFRNEKLLFIKQQIIYLEPSLSNGLEFLTEK